MTMTASRRAILTGAASIGALSACAPAAPLQAAAKPSDALGDKDATAIAAAIRAKEITALEAIDAAIARAERLNPKLNAIVLPLYEQARAQAKAGAPAGPFAGAPMLVKDLNDIAGVRTTYGSRAFLGNIATADDPFVAAMKQAGFIVFGKSNTPEFGYLPTTEGLALGAARNPWNLDHSAGGSSGGAASATAARILPIAHANDGGGSIRIPASCCGLFGLKPSRARMRGDAGASEAVPVALSVNHAVSISVRDSAGLFAAAERADGPLAPVGMVTGPAKRRLRIGVAYTGGAGTEPDAAVRAMIEATVSELTGLGHSVRPVAAPIQGQAFADAFLLYWSAGAAQDAQAVAKATGKPPSPDTFEPLSFGLVAHYQKNADQLPAAIAALKAAEAQFAAAFADIDVLLTPVLSNPPPRLGELAPTLAFEALRERLFRYVAYTPAENVAGAPAMSVPLFLAPDGLPIGAHFSARVGDERTLFELAYELEAARPWAGRKPALSA